MISSSRHDELHDNFWSETNEDWTQEWRDELTAEEAVLIRAWDKRANEGMTKMCEKILKAEKKEGWRPL